MATLDDNAPGLLHRVNDAGMAVFTSGIYNLNIIGVRANSGLSNGFDDEIHLIYKDHNSNWVDLNFAYTTDPGLYWLEHPMRVTGTAILKGGQYRGAYKIGTHRTYEALVQRGRVSIYRDNNRDEILDHDPESEDSGYYGINIPHAGKDSTSVDRWSAGCQVIANLAEWEIFMAVVRRSAEQYGPKFTYTLVDAFCSTCQCDPCDCDWGTT